MALREVAAVFLKLGAASFGGPAVHIALLEHEVVRKRHWLSPEEFLDLLGATNLIPGPNSTEMAIHIGLRRAGWSGFVVAGGCFIVPAFLITLACAWFYERYAALPHLQGLLAGIKPVVLAIVAQALWRLGRTALKSPPAMVVAAAGITANLLGAHELLVLLLAGIVAPLMRRRLNTPKPAPPASPGSYVPPIPPPELVSGVPGSGSFTEVAGAASITSVAVGAGLGVKAGLLPLFLFFLKVGAVLYGSGYVLLAFLRADLVERWGWLTEAQLLDAVAVGQITPGPLFTTATFIGYILLGPAGACAATTGMFLPSFVFVAISAPLVPRLRKSPLAGACLDGVNAASLALMAAVTLKLCQSAFPDAFAVLLGLSTLAALLITRVNPIWLILAGGVLGIAAF